MATLKQVIEHSKVAWGVSKMLARVARHAFAAKRIENRYNRNIAKLESERDQKVNAERERMNACVHALLEHLENNKNVFVKGLKSVTYAIGKVGFRESKTTLEIAKGYTEKDVIERFKRRHQKFLDITYKLDKNAIKKALLEGEYKSLTGVQIRQSPEFFISLAPRGALEVKTISIPLTKK